MVNLKKNKINNEICYQRNLRNEIVSKNGDLYYQNRIILLINLRQITLQQLLVRDNSDINKCI